MSDPDLVLEKLTRRERQVLDVLLAENDLSAAEIQRRAGDEMSYSATRAVLRVLVQKGLLSHHYDGPRYLYRVTLPRQQTRKALLKRMLDTYFAGSRESLLETLIADGEASPKELKKMARLIDRAR